MNIELPLYPIFFTVINERLVNELSSLVNSEGLDQAPTLFFYKSFEMQKSSESF